MSRRTESVDRKFFEDLFAGGQDPWNFETSAYERAKYDATLEVIGRGHANALEIGCSIGVFTRRLAERCGHVLGVDIAESALEAARVRCRDCPNVTFRRMQLPHEFPVGQFDLVTLSEVGYYWTPADLETFLAWLKVGLRADGLFVMVHWTGETNYPQTAGQVHDRVNAATEGVLRNVFSATTGQYRLDALAGRSKKALLF
jgi:cyclopropane fatty-acyl-phospholipid synthase-like methyltransferase